MRVPTDRLPSPWVTAHPAATYDSGYDYLAKTRLSASALRLTGAGHHCSRQKESGGQSDNHRGYGLQYSTVGAALAAALAPYQAPATACDRR